MDQLQQLQLIGAKRIVSAKPIEVGANIYPGNKNYWRLRFFISAEDYANLSAPFRNGATIRHQVFGHAASGLVITLTEHVGLVVTQASQSTVGFNASCREVHATESKVSRTELQGVLAELEDKTRVIFIGPLPEKFLSTKVRAQLKERPEPRAKSIQLAFEAAGIEAPHAVEPVREPPAPPKEVPPAAPANDAAAITGHPELRQAFVDTKDLKEMLDFANEAANVLRGRGVEVLFHTNEEGQIKARVRMTIDEEV